jgi:hypothetical protein
MKTMGKRTNENRFIPIECGGNSVRNKESHNVGEVDIEKIEEEVICCERKSAELE